jgi:hypothetical protein
MAKVLVDKDFLDDGLELICDSIRLKTGGTGLLAFPVEIKQAVDAIETGSGGITPTGKKEITENGDNIDVTTYAAVKVAVPAGTDTSDATAAAGDIRTGKTAYVNGVKVTGSLQEKSAQTYTPSTSNQVIASGKILTGNQTILGDADLTAANIKAGVTIFGVEGTYAGTNTGDATAAAGDIRTGKTAYVNGVKVTGSLQEKSAQTYTPTTSDQVIASGKILTGDQTIKGSPYLAPGNIKEGVTIFGVTGNYSGSGGGTPSVDVKMGNYVTVSRTSTKVLAISGLNVSPGETLIGLYMANNTGAIEWTDYYADMMVLLPSGNGWIGVCTEAIGGILAGGTEFDFTMTKYGETACQLNSTGRVNFLNSYKVWPIVAKVQ